MNGLLDRLAPAARGKAPASLEAMLTNEAVTDAPDGRWSWEGREAWREIVRTLDRCMTEPEWRLTLRKSTQIGATVITETAAARLVGDLRRNVIYWLPTDLMADQFGGTRVKRLFESNARFAAFKDAVWKGKSTANLKEFNGRYFYTRGLDTKRAVISIPADALLFDEVDQLDQKNMKWAAARLDAKASLKFRFYFSQTFGPGFGIDEMFQEGSRRRWVLKCPACRQDDQIAEELFPLNVERDPHTGRHAIVCVRCRKPLDMNTGRWVAEHPGRERDARHISYSLSQLALPGQNSLDSIMRAWAESEGKPTDRAIVECTKLCRPVAGPLQPITPDVLARARGEYAPTCAATGAAGARTWGVDVGHRCHFVCVEWPVPDYGRVIWIEEIDADELVERVYHLHGILGCAFGAIDANPEGALARAIGYRLLGHCFVQHFADGADTEQRAAEHEGKYYTELIADRTASLDDTAGMLRQTPPKLVLPSAASVASLPVWETFSKHLQNLRKEETPRHGEVTLRYKRGVENHFGLALNSAILAAKAGRVGGGVVHGPIEIVTGEPGHFERRAW